MTATDRKALTVRIRLHGTPAERAVVPDTIAYLVRDRHVSLPYPDASPREDIHR
ncbi:hypothetical protein GCM10029963_50670 [Micromonospora andamanensis]|nr:hypothetical protein Vwe01_28130 [Micromonospora andamanensis]